MRRNILARFPSDTRGDTMAMAEDVIARITKRLLASPEPQARHALLQGLRQESFYTAAHDTAQEEVRTTLGIDEITAGFIAQQMYDLVQLNKLVRSARSELQPRNLRLPDCNRGRRQPARSFLSCLNRQAPGWAPKRAFTGSKTKEACTGQARGSRPPNFSTRRDLTPPRLHVPPVSRFPPDFCPPPGSRVSPGFRPLATPLPLRPNAHTCSHSILERGVGGYYCMVCHAFVRPRI